MAIGFFILLGQAGLIAVGAPLVVLVYSAIVFAEDEYLSRQYGDRYAAYRERVNRWLPHWKGFRQSVAPMRFNWQRVLVKEYNTIFAALAGLLFIQAWTQVTEGAMTDGYRIWIIASACVLLGAYLGVRVLKKKGLLRSWKDNGVMTDR
jgi:protein-S-isoprenylcysteine O-methyltransferase Ste14